MRQAHLKLLLKTTGLSPEQLGRRIGVSGMSVRRWAARGRDFAFEPIYAAAIRDAVYQLIIDGALDASSACAREILAQSRHLQQEAAIASLGLPADLPRADELENHPKKVLAALAQIGSEAARRADVDERRAEIVGYRKMGKEWSSRIGSLLDAVRSSQVGAVEKAAAYGALAYLLAPLDLIPDAIPVFGMVDDFSMVGIAAAFCAARLGRNAEAAKASASAPRRSAE